MMRIFQSPKSRQRSTDGQKLTGSKAAGAVWRHILGFDPKAEIIGQGVGDPVLDPKKTDIEDAGPWNNGFGADRLGDAIDRLEPPLPLQGADRLMIEFKSGL